MSVLVASVAAFVAQAPPPGVPNPPAAVPPGLEPLATMFLGWLKWGMRVAGVGALLYCAVQIIIGRRNRNQMAIDGLMGIPWVLAGLALGGVAAILVGTVAL